MDGLPSKPGIPTGPITATPVAIDTIELTWQPPADDGGTPITNYVIEKRDTNRLFPIWLNHCQTPDDKTAITLKCLPTGFDMYFRVAAVNSIGTGDFLEMKTPITIKSPYERNVFRYQYLLIDIGTTVMRAIFDGIVGKDFGQYLVTSGNYANLMKLIAAKIITQDQALLLPPQNPAPNSMNFDITLLTCLLKNLCGLRPHWDTVWKNPASHDLSLEADIGRLKDCRNNLQHSTSVFVNESVMINKWSELKQILSRLNTDTTGSFRIPTLTSLINEAEKMDIDQELKRHFDLVIKLWGDMDKFEEIQQGLAQIQLAQTTSSESMIGIQGNIVQINQHLVDVKQGQSDLKRAHEEELTIRKRSKLETRSVDLRTQLIDIYKDECGLMPVSPLYETDEEIDLLSIYQPPSLWNIPYHRYKGDQDEKCNVTSYKEIFHKDDQQFRKVFITGDAGVGKTSLCKRMALIWSMAKTGIRESGIQDDIDFINDFELVYYVSLSGTCSNDIVNIIVDQLFKTENKEEKNNTYQAVKMSLREKKCLVILDALDECIGSGKINTNRVLSDKSTYLYTCRPYRIEHDRLSVREIDRQIQLRGISKKSIKQYIAGLVTHLNKVNRCNKELPDFLKDIWRCKLYEQLRIPIIGSHLVGVWFNYKLHGMCRARLYGVIVDMLFKRAEMVKHIDLPSSEECEHQFPASLSDLCYLEKHASFLKKICLLAFNILFKRDKGMSELIFTAEQLESRPYCISAKDINFLFKLGVLSKSKVIGRIGIGEQKLAFLHKSYIEFFSALFVTSFDLNNDFDEVVNNWRLINDVVQYKSFFIFFAGLSYQKSKICLDKVFPQIQDDLRTCRHNAVFQVDWYIPIQQIRSLQSMVLKCYDEVQRSSDTKNTYRLDDVVSDSGQDTIPIRIYTDSSDDEIDDRDPGDDYCAFHAFLEVASSNIKSLFYYGETYGLELDRIVHLECLRLCLNSHPSKCINPMFYQLMTKNQTTLHTLSISNGSLPQIPVRNLPCLTSLSLVNVRLSHDFYHDLIRYISSNVDMLNIKLHDIKCNIHGNECSAKLNLANHSKLHSLHLGYVNLTCRSVNTVSLKSLTLKTWCKDSDANAMMKSIKSSQIEHLVIGDLKSNTVNTLLSIVSTLPCLTYLDILDMTIPDKLVLRLHGDITQAKIKMTVIKMNRTCFDDFVESLVSLRSKITVELYNCKISSGYDHTSSYMSEEDTIKYMENCVKQKLPNANTVTMWQGLVFETSDNT